MADATKESKLVLKSFGTFEIKDAETGEVEAIVATLSVVDNDEDIIRPDAITDGAKVAMSDYGHSVVYGDRPVGKGKLHIEGNKAVFRGRLFLKTHDGRETFETLKEMETDQQWSFGFQVLGAEVPSEAERKMGARRILTKLDAFEVSPVIRGAGIGTRTVGVKAAEDIAPPPDPAIEAARVAAEQAEAERRAVQMKQRAIDEGCDRRFRRPPAGLPPVRSGGR